MHIGGHALSPSLMSKSIRAAMHAAEPKTWAGKQMKAMTDFMFGDIDKAMELADGTKLTIRDMVDEMAEVGAIKKEAFDFEAMSMAAKITPEEAKSMDIFKDYMASKLNPTSGEFLLPLARTGRSVATVVENQARALNYMKHRMDGLSPELALKEVNRALFDYGDISNYEQYAKLAIPFWTFSRKNLSMHMDVLRRNPGVIKNQIQFFSKLGPSDQERKDYMSPWQEELFALRLNGRILTNFGLPLEDIIKLGTSPGKEALSRLAPLLKYNVEKAVGQDIFMQEDIVKLDRANEFSIVMDVATNRNLPDAIRYPAIQIANMLELRTDKDGKITGNPNKLHATRAAFSGWSRYSSTIGNLTKEEADWHTKALRMSLGIIDVDKSFENMKRVNSSKMRKEIDEFNQKAQVQGLKVIEVPIFFTRNRRLKPHVDRIRKQMGKLQNMRKEGKINRTRFDSMMRPLYRELERVQMKQDMDRGN